MRSIGSGLLNTLLSTQNAKRSRKTSKRNYKGRIRSFEEEFKNDNTTQATVQEPTTLVRIREWSFEDGDPDDECTETNLTQTVVSDTTAMVRISEFASEDEELDAHFEEPCTAEPTTLESPAKDPRNVDKGIEGVSATTQTTPQETAVVDPPACRQQPPGPPPGPPGNISSIGGSANMNII